MPHHSSPRLSGTRTSHAIAPRTPRDFDLLATCATYICLPRNVVSRQLGYDDDYADRLARSSPGKAFFEWLLEQPMSFMDRFYVQALSEVLPDITEIEDAFATQTDQPTARISAAEALAQFRSISKKQED